MKSTRKHPALGILFKREMVRAIQAGTKSQTRRIVRYDGYPKDDPPCNIQSIEYLHDNLWKFTDSPKGHGAYAFAKAKYQVGDIMYVKETWSDGYPGTADPYLYRATYEGGADHKWKPSLYMPYEAARIFLKVTGVRVERLNDISKADAIAEGISGMNNGFVSGYKDYTWPGPGGNDHYLNAYNSYATLWESINGEGSWAANPYVWVYTFERTEKPA